MQFRQKLAFFVFGCVFVVAGCEGTLPTDTEEYRALEASFEAAKTETNQLRSLNDTLNEQTAQVMEDSAARVAEAEAERVRAAQAVEEAEGRTEAVEQEAARLAAQLDAKDGIIRDRDQEIDALRHPEELVNAAIVVPARYYSWWWVAMVPGNVLSASMSVLPAFGHATSVDLWLIRGDDEMQKFADGETNFRSELNVGGRNVQAADFTFTATVSGGYYVVASTLRGDRPAEVRVDISFAQ